MGANMNDNMQGIPPQDALPMLTNRPSSIWSGIGAGFRLLGVLVIGFFAWPLLLPIGTWPIIAIELAWLILLIAWLRHRRTRKIGKTR
jgi:hypothetical protein